uniref:Uncharacterized protein n=1 Tax=Noctiluca scintillans TaxID=2966 RepID=A0A7S1AAW4_NOCSC|mmetsp:Transcript_38862/g.103199  ORF Transcript_38862/g.103199 Transcript_38862/m.103199 type:complete len:240 (+) Transcript_38862:105-824(+)
MVQPYLSSRQRDAVDNERRFRAFASELDMQRRQIDKLSEVVMELHSARQDDWASWRSRESSLVDEARVALEDRDFCWLAEVQIADDLRNERRRRIDAQAELSAVEQRAEKEPSMEAEAMEMRKWRLIGERALDREERVLAGERAADDERRRAENKFARSRQEFAHHVAETEVRVEAREAEALSEAWRLSSELRTEIEARRQAPSVVAAAGSGEAGLRPSRRPLSRLEEVLRSAGNSRVA